MLSEGLVARLESGPSRPTLVYDASCGFCRRWVGRVRGWDSRRAIRFLPLHDEEAATITGRPVGALESAVHLACPDGSVYAGAAAARELFCYLPGGKPLSFFLGLPPAKSLAARVYSWIARRYGPVR